MSDHHIDLGLKADGTAKHHLPCYPQPFRRITKRLGGVIDALRGSADDDGGVDTEKFVGGLGDRLYETLVTFVPRLPEFLPEHEFNGYASPVAMKEDDYDEDNDTSPTLPQFIDAFDTIIEVNGGKRFLALLGQVFDPGMLKAEASIALSEWRERSTGSPNSPGTSTESLPSGSTTTAPTAEPWSGSSETASPGYVPLGEWWRPEPSGEPLTTSG